MDSSCLRGALPIRWSFSGVQSLRMFNIRSLTPWLLLFNRSLTVMSVISSGYLVIARSKMWALCCCLRLVSFRTYCVCPFRIYQIKQDCLEVSLWGLFDSPVYLWSIKIVNSNQSRPYIHQDSHIPTTAIPPLSERQGYGTCKSGRLLQVMPSANLD